MTITVIPATLRPAEPADRSLLCEVYASTRYDELAPIPWSDEQKRDFLAAQFEAQDAYYREHYVGASYDVIEVDGRAAGRLYVARWENEIRIMDIALLPEHRGHGVGTSLLRELLEEGERTGKSVSIHVERHNPALRLYERLGFRPVGEHGVYVLMRVDGGGDP
jgi:ribosomal protein S18 acetylase RimI-like enzyme